MAEALANFRDYGIPVSQAMPLVFVAITAKVQAVLDLTDGQIQRTLGVSAWRMRTTPWRVYRERGEEAITQALGRIAFEQKLEGILVPSARVKGAVNIALFPSRRRRRSTWRIRRAKRLPPNKG